MNNEFNMYVNALCKVAQGQQKDTSIEYQALGNAYGSILTGAQFKQLVTRALELAGKIYSSQEKSIGSLKADQEVTGTKYATIDDQYNDRKQWHVYRTPCRHYSVVQVTAGQVTGVGRRVGKRFIQDMIGQEVK